MPPLKRTAPRRSARVIDEDLRQARSVGGILRASDDDLAATLDLLTLTENTPPDERLARAWDLLLSYVRRGCERHQADNATDPTAQAAAASLQQLLCRRETDSEKARTVRREAGKAAGFGITDEAIRKREDRIIRQIAEAVFADLQARRSDEPQSLEDAIHRLVPVAADVRQMLHDLLCVTYQHVPPADPRERRVIEGFYRVTVIDMGRLLRRCTQLFDLALNTPKISADDYWFQGNALELRSYLFDEYDDRHFIQDFDREHDTDSYEDCFVALLASERGQQLYDRWMEWTKSCYPNCAFERTTQITYMCSPHALITRLYDLEARYLDLGLSKLAIPGNEPLLRHHRLSSRTSRQDS